MSDPAAIPPPSVYNQAISGVIVNERTIISIMAMASCVRVLGDAASSITPHVHRQVGSVKKFSDPEVDSPPVIYDPCADIDREQADFNLVASWCLGGNGYFHIIDREDGTNPSQVEILSPSTMLVRMVNGKRVYRVGAETNPAIPNRDIVHVPWLSLASGLVGLNPVEIGAVGFGLTIAQNEYASRYFAQGIHPTGLLSLDKPLREPDKERVTDELMTRHGGLAQSHTPIVLDSNAKWTQISVNPQTAQLLEGRAFSRSEIGGFYGVPGHLIGNTDARDPSAATGLQEMVMGFALFALSGYTRRLDRMYSKLLPAGYYVRRNVQDLFNTNYEMLGAYVTALRMNSIGTPNELRELVKLPPSHEDGADSLFAPINSAHSDFMVEGGGALPANPAAADTGVSSNVAGNTGAPPGGNRSSEEEPEPWPEWRLSAR
jgi:HK97 family phage portal protein